MKIAFCIRGLHEEYKKSCENIKTMLIDDLRSSGNTVDVFFNTYETSLCSDLIDFYKPVHVEYKKPRQGPAMWVIVSKQIGECCDIIKQYSIANGVTYDYIIITRFDLTFNNKYNLYDIKYNKINMECMFVPDFCSGDNFLLFDTKFSDLVKKSTLECDKAKDHSHKLWKYFERNGLMCHYIGGETTKRHPIYDVMFRFTRHI